MHIPVKKHKSREEQISEWRENIPNIYNGAYRRTYDKAMSGKSLRSAVTAKCQGCTCWQGVEVKNCEIVTCPLWLYRPGHRRSAQQNRRGTVGTKKKEEVGGQGGTEKGFLNRYSVRRPGTDLSE